MSPQSLSPDEIYQAQICLKELHSKAIEEGNVQLMDDLKWVIESLRDDLPIAYVFYRFGAREPLSAGYYKILQCSAGNFAFVGLHLYSIVEAGYGDWRIVNE